MRLLSRSILLVAVWSCVGGYSMHASAQGPVVPPPPVDPQTLCWEEGIGVTCPPGPGIFAVGCDISACMNFQCTGNPNDRGEVEFGPHFPVVPGDIIGYEAQQILANDTGYAPMEVEKVCYVVFSCACKLQAHPITGQPGTWCSVKVPSNLGRNYLAVDFEWPCEYLGPRVGGELETETQQP